MIPSPAPQKSAGPVPVVPPPVQSMAPSPGPQQSAGPVPVAPPPAIPPPAGSLPVAPPPAIPTSVAPPPVVPPPVVPPPVNPPSVVPPPAVPPPVVPPPANSVSPTLTSVQTPGGTPATATVKGPASAQPTYVQSDAAERNVGILAGAMIVMLSFFFTFMV